MIEFEDAQMNKKQNNRNINKFKFVFYEVLYKIKVKMNEKFFTRKILEIGINEINREIYFYQKHV
jgi:hypothetical protein